MRHRKNKIILGRTAAPRRAVLGQLATSIVLYETVRTTRAKATAVRPLVEKCITIGKESTLAHRRLLLNILSTEGAVKKILEVLSPRYKNRKGGYTRATKLGKRLGDSAEMVEISFV